MGFYSTMFRKNGQELGSPGFMPSEEAFLHFGDIYSPSTSSTDDYGHYETTYIDSDNNAQVIEYFVVRQSKFEEYRCFWILDWHAHFFSLGGVAHLCDVIM